MKFSIWQLLVLTFFAAVSVAVVVSRDDEVVVIGAFLLSILYASTAIAFIVYGSQVIRAFAIGASVPLVLLLGAMSFSIGVLAVEGSYSFDRFLVSFTFLTAWLLAPVCGAIIVAVRYYTNENNAGQPPNWVPIDDSQPAEQKTS